LAWHNGIESLLTGRVHADDTALSIHLTRFFLLQTKALARALQSLNRILQSHVPAILRVMEEEEVVAACLRILDGVLQEQHRSEAADAVLMQVGSLCADAGTLTC
jgi:hypothetical protein